MKFYCILFVALGVALINEAVVFKFSNLVCESYNTSWFVLNNCRLRAISRDRVLFDMNGTNLYPAYIIHVYGKLFKRANGLKPWLYEFELDCCRFLKKNYNPVAKIVFNLFKEFSNINHTCPYVGPIIIRGFYLRSEVLRLPFPTGEYMLSLRWHFNHTLQLDTNVSFVFVEDLLHSKK